MYKFLYKLHNETKGEVWVNVPWPLKVTYDFANILWLKSITIRSVKKWDKNLALVTI